MSVLPGLPTSTDASRTVDEDVPEREPLRVGIRVPPCDRADRMVDRRRGFCGEGEEAALHRFMMDALTVLDRVEEGHEAVQRYMLDQRLSRVTARTFAVRAAGDHYSLPALEKFAAALGCETRILSGGHVAAPEQLPREFAGTVLEWAARG